MHADARARRHRARRGAAIVRGARPDHRESDAAPIGVRLRAIGDPRAVPALIRAIPRTLLPCSSDYGLIVDDKELTEFMQKHDLRQGKGGTYFDLGRPVRESSVRCTG